MNKIFSLFMVLILIIVSSITFSACKEEDRIFSANIETDDIAKLSLFSFDGENETKYGIKNLGHAWIAIENISSEPIQILSKEIAVNETVAIGSWSLLEHFGVWFNIESNYITKHNKYDGRVSITIGINAEDINIICDYIENNDRWNPIFNCSRFSYGLYNSVASESEYISKALIITPTYLSQQIKKFDNYEYNKPIPTSDIVGYINNNNFVSFKMEGGSYENI